jgi:hypothetical protein
MSARGFSFFSAVPQIAGRVGECKASVAKKHLLLESRVKICTCTWSIHSSAWNVLLWNKKKPPDHRRVTAVAKDAALRSEIRDRTNPVQVSNSTLSKLLDYKPGQCILSSRGGAKMLAQAAFPYTHKWAGHFHLLFRSPGSRPIFCFGAHERRVLVIW